MTQSLGLVALATGLLLLVPAAGMVITSEFSWGWMDFVLAAALLFTAGAAIVLALRLVTRPVHRKLAVLAIVFSAALVWAELAVGLFH